MPTAEEILAPSPGALLRRRIFRHWGLLIGGSILAVMVLMALLAPLVAPHDPLDQQLARKLIPPVWHTAAKATWAHPLGTDHLGRDYLSRLLYGAQISLLIGFSAMLISGVIGTVMGVLAGWLVFAGTSSPQLRELSGASGQYLKLFLTTGVLGGYTTFSAFSLEAALFLERGRVGAAFVYAAASVILSITGLLFGLTLMRT